MQDEGDERVLCQDHPHNVISVYQINTAKLIKNCPVCMYFIIGLLEWGNSVVMNKLYCRIPSY